MYTYSLVFSNLPQLSPIKPLVAVNNKPLCVGLSILRARLLPRRDSGPASPPPCVRRRAPGVCEGCSARRQCLGVWTPKGF